MPSTEIAAEQVLLAWSSSNLLGVSGMGPVAASTGWKLSGPDTFAGLGDAGRLLPAGAAAELAVDAELPTCLEYRPTADGALLVAKVYSRRSQRPGQYQVHALRAEPGLSSWDLWRIAGSGTLTTEELSEVPNELAAIQLKPTRAPRIQPDLDDVGPLARLLQCVLTDRPFLASCSDQGAGVEAIRTLLGYLPLPLVREIPVCSFVSSGQLWTRGVGLVIPGSSLDAPSPDLNLDDYDFVAAPASYQELAELFVRGEGTSIRTLAEAESWLSLAGGDLDSLSDVELRTMLQGPFFSAFLSKLADHPSSGKLLRRLRTDSSAEAAMAARLRQEVAEQAALIASLVRGLGEQPAALGGPAQAWLLQSVGDSGFVNHLLTSLMSLSRTHGVRVQDESLALAIGERCQPEDLDGFEFDAAPRSWSAVCEAEYGRHLLESKAMSSASQSLVRQHPELAAAYLDRQVSAHRWTLGRVGRAIERCPDAELESLIQVLLHSEQLPQDWAVRTLASRSPELARDILADQWPAIAEKLGIPGPVAELLTVRKAGWWRGR